MMYLVCAVIKSHKIKIPTVGDKLVLDLKLEWADGMCGAMPVFDNYEDAEKYANGQNIIEIEEITNRMESE